MEKNKDKSESLEMEWVQKLTCGKEDSGSKLEMW